MTRRVKRKQLLNEPIKGTKYGPSKQQGYRIPLPLWQELLEESSRRKKLGLPLDSQNAIAVEAIREWLETNKGGV